MHENQTRTAKYTPGPWHVGMKPGPMVYGPLGEQIADCRTATLPGTGNGMNARLISLTPRMVDALRAAMPFLEAGEIQAWNEGGPETLPEAEEVRAILREIDEE